MGSLFTNLVQKVVISRKWTENGPRMDREWTDEVAEKSARMSTVWTMMWVNFVKLVNLVMQIFKWTKWTKWTEQICAESAKSAKSAKSIFATFATFASANFVGKASCESTVRYREWSRISLIKPLLNPYLALTRFRLSLGSNLSRFSLASLICLCMLTVGVGNAWGATQNFVPSDFSGGTSGTGSAVNKTLNGIQVSTDKGYATTQFRVYKSGKLTISSDYTIKAINFSTNSNYGGGLSNQANLTTTSWSFTTTGQARITQIVVTYLAKVTFNANEGSCATSNLTQATASSSITLPTPTRSGYICKGWYTASSGGTKRGNAGATYTPTVSETLYAQWEADAPAYTITAERNNASYGNVSLSGTTITATPAACCEYASPAYTVSPAGSATVSQVGNAFTVTPSANTTVTINFQEKSAGKTVNFDAGAGVCATTSLTEDCDGSGVVLPNVTASGVCKGWTTFAGWATAAIATADSTTTNPGTLYAAGSTYYPSSDNETLYAVFSKTKSTGGSNGSVVVTYNSTYFPDSYGTANQFTEYTLEGYKFKIQQIYNNNSKMQWRASGNTNGTGTIYNTQTFPNHIKSIVIVYDASDSNKNIALKVGTSENPTSGTSITPSISSSTYTFDCTGGTYDYFVLTNGSGAGYTSSVTINYGSLSTTYYCSDPNCCTPLGSINGSVSWSNGTSATLTWDKLSNVDGTTPYAVSVSPSTGVTVNSIDLTGAKATCSVTGLTAGTAYTFTINAYGDATHCDKDQEIASTAPQITVKSAPVALTGSDYAEGVSGGGTVKTFTVSGVGLTGALTFTAPTYFQVSTDNGSTWSTSGGSKTLAASGTLAETTIKARLVEGLSVGTYGGATTYITISGGGAAAVNSSVSITGTVSSACSVPTIGNPSLTNITGTTITVSCPTISGGTNCDVDEYGFIWKVGSAPTMASYDVKKKTGENNQSTAYNDGLSINVVNNTGTTYYIKAYAHNSAGNNVSGTALEVTPQSVTFVSNGGSSVATAYVNNGGTVSKPSNPTLANYDFDNWYTDDKTFVSAVDFSSAITEDRTYYANWTETLHDVTVEYKCGSTTVKTSTTIENVGVVTIGSTTAPNDITGYTWSTWSAMPSGVTTSTTPLTTPTITINATADGKTITANYTANQYDITYKDEGDAAYSGNNEGSLPSKHTYGSATALIEGTKTGYDFVGWFTDAACTESAGGSIGATAKTADFTLYAKWTAKEYDVTLKANGGSSSDQVVSATYDAAMPATVKAGTGIVAPTYNGYTFGGYYDNADYTMGTQYYTDALASAHNWDKASTANLYGRWIPNEYVVTLDANGGVDGATTSVTTTFGAAMPTIASANLPTRAGYRFDGFYMGKTDGTKYYNADGTSAKNQARYSDGQVLYAHWVAQLTFSVNGDIDDELTRDDNTAMPSTAAVPTDCGDCWAFMGWSTDSDEDGAPDYAGGATHEFGEPTTLYAVFGKAEYKMINSTSDLVANDNYILTFYYDDTDHEYALSNEKKYTYDAAVTDVTSMVRENGEGWFIYNIGANNIWKFTGTKDAGQLYNAASDKYVNLSSTSSYLLNTTDNLTFSNDGIFWTIKSTNYLKPYSYSSYEISSSEPSYSAFLYHQISAEYATVPSCETYDIVWKVDGTPLSSGSQTEETNECTGIEDLPANPEDDALDCATKFVGWSEQELVGDGHDAPADLFTAIEDAPAINEDKTFHAVFATTIGTSVDPIEDTSFSSKDENGSYCNSTFSFKSTGKYLQQQSIWTSSSIANVTVKIRVYHMSNSVADVLRVSLINSDGSEVVGKDLTTTKTGTDITSKGGWSDVVELTPTSAVTGYKVSLKTKNSSGVAINKIEREVVASGLKDYMTTCCNHLVTLSDGSPANGTVTFDPAGSVETCTGAKEVSMTITPNPGYYLSGWSSSGVAPTSVVPAVVTNTADAQTTTLTFAEGSDNGTYTAGATFTAKALEGWTWMYKKDADVADNSVDPYAIPDVVEIYKDQYARFIITGYAPADVIAEKQGYVYTAGGAEPAYTTDYLTRVANTASYFTLKGKNPVESTTITFKAIGDASITRTMTIRVKALPLVHFVDNVHNVAFDDVVATVETGVVTLTKQTPTQDDFDGTTKNTCEETHLHLVGWIDGDWTPYQAYMNGTGEKPTVSAIIGATGYFYAPNVDIDLVAKDGKTFYAVWAVIE